MNKSGLFWGIILILTGGLLLIDNLGNWQIFSMEFLWPVLILILGLAFEFNYFSKKESPGLLVPGGILTVIGLLFIFETFTHWQFSGYTWPVYPLAVAVGLFQLYLFSGRPRGLLVPVFILTALACISFTGMFVTSIQRYIDLGLVVPILLILAGLILIIQRKKT
ncbi:MULTISPECIES: DUF5668 domain-containing protein [Dehalobacter]|jgi:hypothetical protein|uniref:LiaI-LiaF-like transmembrane region domain-containing protein n=2 Tax=Dehalobacter restrictus TaxID=55583 RepID=A0A857DJA9_9FIRM|nr:MULTISPECIES: DUF5668 domain-containing protein [Dehalobacter]AHF09986.1 membrane protein [Dehalobacter restrictus DSM 9455]MCG1026465.1 hypothetical protein [Dehalobacter sp.]MDJ0306936.1 DUF5668 domain-containing protein [Dehalobacter sp.]OCZ50786.1 hypothetical protein A7D23_14435 [Dehalobacter sp. TeCB1]QHA00582.1 hypothetical protein GQ588_08030 [Dehalobacter restrictus]